MSELPQRPIVITACIPEGESCKGCAYLGEYFDEYECGLHLHPNGERQDISEARLRLPACRERDGYAVYPPGSGVPELVEAAKRRVAAEAEATAAYHDKGSRRFALAQNELEDAEEALMEAVSKVAEGTAKP